jgi:hypothetical protein
MILDLDRQNTKIISIVKALQVNIYPQSSLSASRAQSYLKHSNAIGTPYQRYGYSVRARSIPGVDRGMIGL